MATGESFVNGGILPTIQFVNGQLPDGEAAGGAIATVAVTLVGHPVWEKRIFHLVDRFFSHFKVKNRRSIF